MKSKRGRPKKGSVEPVEEILDLTQRIEYLPPSDPSGPASPPPNPYRIEHMADGRFRHRYGIVLSQELDPMSLELSLYHSRKGLTPAYHLSEFVKLKWPHVRSTWNPWTDRIFEALCDPAGEVKDSSGSFRSVILTGCASAGKTYTSGLFVVPWWLKAPEKSIVILTSTTRERIRQRVWPQIVNMVNSAVNVDGTPHAWGHLIDHKLIVKAPSERGRGGDEKHAIMALPVAKGDTQAAVSQLKGLHAERMMLVIDEANSTPEAIFELISNSRKACREFILLVIGNPLSRQDCHGFVSEPLEGWGAPAESLQWRTKPIDKWDLESGTALRFDGMTSPNVLLGEDRWPFLYTTGNWAMANRPGKARSLGWWSNDRGLWPPTGNEDTIFTEQMFTRDIRDLTFIENPRSVAFLDPAYGGDDCVLTLADFGIIDLATGKLGVQIRETYTIEFENIADAERDRVIATQTIAKCKQWGVAPTHFGLDQTGSGRGIWSRLVEDWSPEIKAISFGSSATERRASLADARPGRDVYDNRVTEMWFSCRELFEAGQLRGIPRETIIDFCHRLYTIDKRGKYALESKRDFKGRHGHSPDVADTIAGVVDVARDLGLSEMTPRVEDDVRAWEAQRREADLDYPTLHDRGIDDLVVDF